MHDIYIKDIMTTDLVTISSEAIVTHVATIFKEESFHHVPVIDREGCLTGIISRTDFERIKNGATLFRNPNIEKYNEVLFQTLRVKDIMTEGVTHLRPTDSCTRAYEIFKENKFRALPVVEKGILVGIVTPLDMLDYFFNPK